jgi:hypothetical protein
MKKLIILLFLFLTTAIYLNCDSFDKYIPNTPWGNVSNYFTFETLHPFMPNSSNQLTEFDMEVSVIPSENVISFYHTDKTIYSNQLNLYEIDFKNFSVTRRKKTMYR